MKSTLQIWNESDSDTKPKGQSTLDIWKAADNAPEQQSPPQQVLTPPKIGIAGYLDKSPAVGVGEAALSLGTGAATGAAGYLGDSVVTGWNLAKNLLNGMDYKDAYTDASQKGLDFLHSAQQYTYQPKTTAGKIALMTVSPVPGVMPYIQQKAEQLTGSPQAGQQLVAAAQNIPVIVGLAKSGLGTIPEEAKATPTDAKAQLRAQWEGVSRGTTDQTLRQSIGAANVSYDSTGEPIAFTKDDVPRTQGFSPEEIQDRQSVLSRIGFNQMHQDFINGNGAGMGGLVQASKTDTLAGQAAKSILENNHSTINEAVNNVASKAGGSIDNAQDALEARGKDITAPIDAMRAVFDNQISGLYKEAEQRSPNLPSVPTDSVDSVLSDKQIRNTALGNGTLNVLKAIKNQWTDFKENNPSITVNNAEQFRKWLNTQWKNDPYLIGQVKDALDDGVAKSAGEDVYGAARQAFIAKKTLLGSSNELDKIFDYDPTDPLNRRVPLEKIGKKVTSLSGSQFNQLMQTYENIGQKAPELNPLVDKAIAALKSHYLTNVSDLGNANKLVWSADKVTKYLNDNNGNMALLFKPDEMSELQDIQRAGHILQADASYPGAEAQKINLLKQGIGPELVRDLSVSGGAAIGGAIGGPAGAALGGMAGKYIGGQKAQAMANKASVGKISGKIVPLNESLRKK